ncbi:MAG TPA: alpha/beta hydrolase [Candidatus Saccharimonadales bacterium]|nr:alpha/beta hydrolase [Candidatus Saccharimonadales bacterium]
MSAPRKTKTNVKTKKQPPKRSWRLFFTGHRRLWTWGGGIIAVLLVIALILRIWFMVSPWPGSLLIRDVFTKGNHKMNAALQKYVPNNIAAVRNLQYRSNDKDASLNVFYPDGTTAPLPTIVWVHGGGWVSGNKDDMDNYLQILANQGFTTVTVNYTIAPEKQYPTPIVQLNAALQYLQQNAQRLHIDDTRLLLAGDSAGSQIVAQTADIITSPSYAATMHIDPTLPASKLKGLLLNCGAYDLALPDYSGPFGGFLRTVLWAYSGKKDFLHDPNLATASVVNYLTADFPPSFITAGNADPLLSQSTELAKKLAALGVSTSTLFYPADHQPPLNHEYQFDLDIADGRHALQQMVNFAKQRTE